MKLLLTTLLSFGILHWPRFARQWGSIGFALMLAVSLWSTVVACLGAAVPGPARADVPLLGAQVWIEPGQKTEVVDGWFKTLADHHMPVARLFIMWRYIEPERDRWDFTLYDRAFEAAKKYGIKIFVTLESGRRPPHRGGDYQLHGHEIDGTRQSLEATALYIRKVVEHYKDHPALDSWSPMNEASQSPRQNPLALERFQAWLSAHYQGDVRRLNEAWSTDFRDFKAITYSPWWASGAGYWPWPAPYADWHRSWREHLTWWLAWATAEIRKSDPRTPVHAHATGQCFNLAQSSLDLSAWRAFSSSSGGSFHPSHTLLGCFTRDQLAQGIVYNCELLGGSAEPNPFWITELQGGPNIFSGPKSPMTPDALDIEQWIWTGIGAGAQRVIFWSLNGRLGGWESGEWALLDYQNGPTERITTAGQIAGVLLQHKDFFDGARPVASPITILVSLESMTLDAWKPVKDYPGRDVNAHPAAASG